VFVTKSMTVAALALALSTGAAFAGEGNGEPFANDQPRMVVANQVASDTGSENLPYYGPGLSVLSQGKLVPGAGSEAPIQTANALPPRADQGTVAYAQAGSIRGWARVHRPIGRIWDSTLVAYMN
jgi:hypothetical protein